MLMFMCSYIHAHMGGVCMKWVSSSIILHLIFEVGFLTEPRTC